MSKQTKWLPVKRHYTEQELSQLADDCAQAVEQKAVISAQKKEAMDDFKARLQAAEVTINRTAAARRLGYEMVEKECRLRRDHGRKVREWVDVDSGEVVREEPFLADDYQLALDDEV